MQIRKMRPEDTKEVARLETEIFSVPWSEKAFLDTLERTDTIYLVAEEEGTIYGYCGMWMSFEEGEIPNFAVAGEKRNCGIGQKMLEALFDFGAEEGISAFTLEVRKSNQAAIHLYNKMGFVSEGIRKGFYDKPKEDAVIMWKR